MILRKNNIVRRLGKYVTSVQGRSGAVTLTAGDVDAQTARLDNLTATANPTEDDDGTQGYEVLSKWMNTTTGKMFTCLNIAHGSAIWKAEDINIADLGSASVKNIGTGDDDVPNNATVKSLIPVTPTRESLLVDNVDNTSDVNKPVSNAQALAINDAVQQVITQLTQTINTSAANIDYSTLLNKPVLFSGSYNDLTDKPSLFNGDYLSLTNRPTLFDGQYSSLSGLPQLFDGQWTSLKGVPTFFDGRFSSLTGTPNFFGGSYNDLTDKPSFFDGDYNHLTNKPNLFDGKFSSLTGIPSFFSGSYNDLTNKPNLFDGDYNHLTNKPILFNGSFLSLSDVPLFFSGNYNDLTNKPSLFDGNYSSLKGLPALFNGAYASLTGKPSLFSGSYNDLTDKPNLFNGSYLSLTNTPTLFSGSYNDLTNKPTIPTSTSQIQEGTNLYYTQARVQAYLDLKSIKGARYFEIVTDSNSVWSLDVSAYFSSVDFVVPVALSPVAGALPIVAEQRTATLSSFTTAGVIKGSVTKANSVLALLQLGLALGGAGTSIKVKVEGTLK